MAQKEKNDFDDQLREILSPGDPSRPDHDARAHKPRRRTPPEITPSRPERKIPYWLEFLIRLIAGIIAGVLLALFALHIAGR